MNGNARLMIAPIIANISHPLHAHYSNCIHIVDRTIRATTSVEAAESVEEWEGCEQ